MAYPIFEREVINAVISGLDPSSVAHSTDNETASPAPKPFLGRRKDLAALAVMLFAIAISLFVVRGLKFDPSLRLDQKSNAVLREADEAERIFPSEHLLVISLPCSDPWSGAALSRLASLTKDIENIGRAGGGTWKVYSPLTVADLEKEGEELVQVPLIDTSAGGLAASRHRFESSSLPGRLFLSKDGLAWTVYASVGSDAKSLVSRFSGLRNNFPEVRITGTPWIQAIVSESFGGEFLLLFAVAAAILLVVQLWIVRSPRTAFLLWGFSLVPVSLLLASVVATGLALRVAWVLAPILTLTLGNSWVTNIYRGWALAGFTPRAALRARGPIVLLEVAAAVFGFMSMVLSPIRDLSVLGFMSIAGACLAAVVALVLLPAALGLSKRPSAAAKRYLAVSSRPVVPSGRRWRRLAVFSVAIFVLAVLASRIGVGFRNSDIFAPWTKAGQDIAWFDAHYRGLDEATLVVSTGRENGIVDIDFWRSLGRLERELEGFPGIGSVYAAPDLVGETLARWEGRNGAIDPTSTREIGETLELLSDSGGGLFSRGFANSDWSAAALHVSLAPTFNAIGDFPRLRTKTAMMANSLLPGCRIAWGGDIVRQSAAQEAFIGGQIGGTFAFFALLVLALTVALRSLAKGIAISIVPLVGLLSALGAIHLFGWSLSPQNAVSLCVIIGTGVDNAIFLVMRSCSRDARRTSIDTTVLVVTAMLALLLSSSFLVFQTAVLCALGLVVSTIATVSLLPAIRSVNPALARNRS